MHMLNDNVFGPGELWNLTPGPSQSNHDMEREIEHDLKKAIVDMGLVMTFEATVDYKNDPIGASQAELNENPDKFRFKQIDFEATQWFADSKSKTYAPGANKAQEIVSIDGSHVKWSWGSLTPLKAKPLILSTTDQQELEDIGIDKTSAKKIVDFNAAKTGWALAGRGQKQGQLADAIHAWEKDTLGKKRPRRISLAWDSNLVLWR